MKDYYKILGLTSTCTFSDIRKAYRTKALELHPDVNNSKTAKADFININEAYTVLKNPVRRAQYDNLQFRPLNKTRPSDRRNQRRSSRVYRSAERGKQNGKEQGVNSKDKVEKKSNSIFTWFFGDVIIELALEGIFFIIRLFL